MPIHARRLDQAHDRHRDYIDMTKETTFHKVASEAAVMGRA
jgi:hypothetical protein